MWASMDKEASVNRKAFVVKEDYSDKEVWVIIEVKIL